MPSDVDNDAPRPRLCHLVKWPDFNGFGFNLHAEKAKFGQFIGKVDEGSPAEYAGLREGDRIIEVNGVNVSNENHKQVVERIKAIPYETKLLVVDLETDKYYKSKKIVVKGNQANIAYLKTPATRSGADTTVDANGGEGKNNGTAADYDADERRSQASSIASDRESLNQEADKISRNGSNMSTPPIGRNEDGTRSNGSRSPGTPPPLTPPGGGGGGGQLSRSVSGDSAGAVAAEMNKSLNLNMTASEMRAMLANKKKYDPKKENLDLRKKHAIIQDM